jgi:threonine aldolase
MRERLVEDHAPAAQLAAGLATISGVTMEPVHIRTNMVFFSVPENVNAAEFVAAMKARNVILRGGPHFRAVTHYYITPERVKTVIEAVREVLALQMRNAVHA